MKKIQKFISNAKVYSELSQTYKTKLSAKIVKDFKAVSTLNLQAPTTQNDQTQSNNSSAVADELFECV